MRGRIGYLVAWLLLATVAQTVAFALVHRVFVDTPHGQQLDTIALEGNTIGAGRIDTLVSTVLNTMSVLSLALAIVVVGFIALARGRFLLAAMATLLVVGANLTTQLLKYFIDRPDFGIDVARAAAGNSLPSGHTTVAASVAVALVLVLPPTVRGIGAVAGAGYAGLAGVATLSAGWHRPSDAVAALLVVGAWAAAVGVVLIVAHHRQGGSGGGDGHPVATSALAVLGVVLLVVATIGFGFTEQVVWTPPEALSRNRLLAAYAGSAAGIAGTACLLMALVLATVHRVVPGRGEKPPRRQPARASRSAAGGIA